MTHAAVFNKDYNEWESKMGKGVRILHTTFDALEGRAFGQVAYFLFPPEPMNSMPSFHTLDFCHKEIQKVNKFVTRYCEMNKAVTEIFNDVFATATSRGFKGNYEALLCDSNGLKIEISMSLPCAIQKLISDTDMDCALALGTYFPTIAYHRDNF